ncbi:MAG: WG repeat-containing protein [Bacteroidales bacterium]
MNKITLKLLLICSMFVFGISCSNSGDNGQLDTSLIPVKSGDKWGYINKKGEYTINPQFEAADFFKNGLAMIKSLDGKIGYISKDGKFTISAKYKEGTPFNDGLAFVVSDGDYPTCIDKSDKVIFTLKQANYVFEFSEGLAMFEDLKEKFGFVDKLGKIVVNPQYEKARSFSEGYAAVCKEDKWGFIDKTGKVVIKPQFKSVNDFHSGRAAFSDGKQYGFIDIKGSYLVNPQFIKAASYSEDLSLVMIGEQFGFIDKEGKTVINPQFDGALSFKNGLAPIVQSKKIGFIDKKGKIVINPQFDDTRGFIGDISPVKSGDKWGFIDKKGTYVINPQFDEVVEPINIYMMMYDGFGRSLFSYVKTNYYDASKFITEFFKNVNNKSFKGFDSSVTLKSLIENPIYSQTLRDESEYKLLSYQNDEITSDIILNRTNFYFSESIYTMFQESNFSGKLAAVEYKIVLAGEAHDKGGKIVNALKIELERIYGLKLESQSKQKEIYASSQKGAKLNFAIYNNTEFESNTITLLVGIKEEKFNSLIKEILSNSEAIEIVY